MKRAYRSINFRQESDKMGEVIAREKKERKHLVAALPQLVEDIREAVEADNE